MAYADSDDLVRAAGGEANLVELSDLDGDGDADTDVLEAAQRRADSWINTHSWHLHSGNLPFNPVPDFIRELAAEEAIYRLKRRRRVDTEVDRQEHEERRAELEAIKLGTSNPTTDAYPIGAAGVPTAVNLSSRTTTDEEEDDFATEGFL